MIRRNSVLLNAPMGEQRGRRYGNKKGKIRKPQFIWKDRLLREKVHYGESRFERNLKKG